MWEENSSRLGNGPSFYDSESVLKNVRSAVDNNFFFVYLPFLLYFLISSILTQICLAVFCDVHIQFLELSRPPSALGFA
jgi:hypothetical protein